MTEMAPTGNDTGTDADAHGDIPIGPGCEVVMHFTLSLADGTLVETSRQGEPLCFTLGDETLIPGLEQVLHGHRAGEQLCRTLQPQEAFGFADLDNSHTLALSDFPATLSLEPGVVIGFDTPSGENVPGTIQAVEGDEVLVDFNHPLAGHAVTFAVDILAVTLPGHHATPEKGEDDAD